MRSHSPVPWLTTLPMLGYYAVTRARRAASTRALWSAAWRGVARERLASRVISIVVPNWNGAGHLGPCIRSLAAQDHGDFEIVVVDNGSVDDSVAVLEVLAREIAPVPLTVLRNDVNLGFAGGVNRGIRHAIDSGASAVALFNNDAVADAGWLSRWWPCSTPTPGWRSPPAAC